MGRLGLGLGQGLALGLQFGIVIGFRRNQLTIAGRLHLRLGVTIASADILKLPIAETEMYLQITIDKYINS